MILRIDTDDPTPLGQQIIRGLRLAIAQGRVAAGDQLPSARDLAAQLKVNFHTVRKAYGDLEQEGLLELRRGRGTFVAQSLKLRQSDLRAIVREHLRRLVAELAGTGLDAEQIEQLVLAELARTLPKTAKR